MTAGPVTAPLTAGQERLWFLAQLDPESPAYHMYVVERLTGPLSRPALESALHAVVARHEPLRTRFPVSDGQPVQEVLPHWSAVLELVDVSDLPDPQAAARAEAARRTNTPFDLADAPPVRVALIRTGPAEHVLCLVLHHLLADAWSIGVIFTELAESYEAHLDGRPAALPPLAARYTDVAVAQQSGGQDDSAALAFWARQLADLAPLDLPTDRPRPPVRNTAGGHVQTAVGREVADGLRALCRTRRCTLFMAVVAAYQATLGWYADTDDVVIGTPISGRSRTEWEPLVGFFLNTLVLRGDLSGEPSFAELLSRVRSAALEAYRYADVPYERLLTRLQVSRDASRDALFDAMLVVHAGDAARPVLRGVAIEPFDHGLDQARFDLTLEVDETPDGGLRVLSTYRTDLFDARTAAGFGERFVALLAAAVADPDASLPQLRERIAQAEAGDSASTWSGSPAIPATAPTVVEMLAAQIASTPDAVAVTAAEGSLTYRDLDLLTGPPAGRLREHGAGPDRLVAVCVEPGAALIVALLAVLRAGAAYLPLNPAYPAARLTSMLADSGADLVLAREDRAEALAAPGRTVVCLTDETGPGPAWCTPDVRDLAYAIYTSGSTGKPKAVLVEHGALAVRVAWMGAEYGIGPTDRVLQFAPASFDTFAEEVYPCLTAGATLVVPPGPAAALPDFLATPAGAELTVLDLPSSYWHELVADLDAIRWPPAMRLLILGAEQVRGDALGRWFAAFGDRVRVLNTYGPTEATIIATWAELTTSDAAGRPPIGRPIAGTATVILDRSDRPVPAGIPGELLLSGPGLARGYADGDDDRFVARNGRRWYRTGDRVRQRPDGALEYLGRLDQQLKVRGHRIEPGEVEAALTAHPAVRHAVVTARDGRLIGYVVAEAADSDADARTLRVHLTALLPEHLVPDAFVTLPALPLTPNGKVDRAALPAPAATVQAARAQPTSDAELLVAEVWQEVLGVESIGTADNFFDLGGHSLLATRVTSRIRAAIGVEVPIAALFRQPTVAGFAETVEDLVVADLAELTDEEAARLLTVELDR